MERLSGTSLVNKQGNTVSTAKALEGKAVLFYFSAHWCPPCRQFTPMLKTFYDQAKASGHPIEIVFFSADRSETDMMNYFRESHGDYLAVKFDEDARQSVSRELGVRGIPALILVDKSGKTLVDGNECRTTVVEAARGMDVSSKLLSWRQKAGDWTSQEGVKLGSNSSSSAPKSRDEIRQARLAALGKKDKDTKTDAKAKAKDAKDTEDVQEKKKEDAVEEESNKPVMVKDLCEKLMGMGFTKQQVESALEAADNNFETALEFLVG